LVQNELVSLRLMRAAGVPVITSSACRLVEGVFETPRYDRVGDRRSSITRLHQEDFCQATGRRPYAKYESRGGPSLGDIRILIQKHSADPLTDVEIVARWAAANAVIGNSDGHAKNLSFLHTSDGLRLAPVYDVVCTEAYEFLGKNLAISIGGRPNLASIDDTAIDEFARTFLLNRGTARDLMDEVVGSISNSLDDVIHDVETDVGSHQVLQRIQSLVKAKCTDWFA
ncbi:HipA domain-containing protein, partial [Gemmatimonadota bacterium]